MDNNQNILEKKRASFRSLYEELLKIAKEVSHEGYQINVLPIGEESPLQVFGIYINTNYLALICLEEVALSVALQNSLLHKDLDIKYYIQQKSSDSFIVMPSKLPDFGEVKVSEVKDIANSIFKTYTKEELVKFLELELLPLNEKLKKTLNNVVNNFRSDHKKICDALSRIARNLGKAKGYDFTSDDKCFRFSEPDEKKLHGYFFTDGAQPKHVCRYCSLESLYQMLSKKTIRLNGIVGMNDKLEYKYALDSFFTSREFQEEIDEQMNNVYIISCSSMSLKDDLEMWRLYGDDGKGVCLIYEVEKSQPPFVLAKTIYEYTRKNGKNVTDSKWKLLKQLSEELRNIGLPLRFINPNKWLPLLKSGDYCYENEIRLLTIETDKIHDSSNWVLTNQNSIFNPFVQYDIFPQEDNGIEGELQPQVPLKLKGIILGPKCSEKEVNAKQIKNMLNRDQNFKELQIEVTISAKNNYR